MLGSLGRELSHHVQALTPECRSELDRAVNAFKWVGLSSLKGSLASLALACRLRLHLGAAWLPTGERISFSIGGCGRFPGAAIAAAVLSFNVMGDWLRCARSSPVRRLKNGSTTADLGQDGLDRGRPHETSWTSPVAGAPGSLGVRGLAAVTNCTDMYRAAPVLVFLSTWVAMPLFGVLAA
jgi:hypothetical protein